jgi:hypothetical protein
MENLIFILQSTDKAHLAILKDVTVKKYIQVKIVWGDYLYLELDDKADSKTTSYILLKYGDYIKPTDSVIRDFSPTMFVDYIPNISEEQKHLLNKS